MDFKIRSKFSWVLLVLAGTSSGTVFASTLEIELLDEQDSTQIPNATIELWDSGGQILTAETDTAGMVRIEELPAGKYFLVADAPGYVQYLWQAKRFERQCLRSVAGFLSFENDCPSSLGDPIELDGVSPTSVTASLQRAGTLRVSLTAADGSVPDSVPIAVYSWERYRLRVSSAGSMQNGVVEIEDLIPDEYFVVAQEDSRHVRMTYPDIPLSVTASQRRSGDRVVIRPGKVTDVSMTRIEGTSAVFGPDSSSHARVRDPYTNAIVGYARPEGSSLFPPQIFPEGSFFLEWPAQTIPGGIVWISHAHSGQLCVEEECHRYPVEIIDFSKHEVHSLAIENADLSSFGRIVVNALFPFDAFDPFIGPEYSGAFVSFGLSDEHGRIARQGSTEHFIRTSEGWRVRMRFDNVPAGRYLLRINPFVQLDGERIATVLHNGKRCRWNICEPGPEDMFRLEEGQNLELDVFNSQTEERLPGIDLSLWDEELDEPVHDGRVYLYDDEFHLIRSFSVRMNRGGFTLDVEPGTYYLSTRPPEPKFGHLNNINNAHIYSMNGVSHCGASCRIEDSVPVQYSGENVVAVRIKQKRGMTISGQVRQPDGEAGVSIGIELYTESGALYKKTFSGYSGKFRFFGLEPGSYRIRTRNAQGFSDTAPGGLRCDPDCDLDAADLIQLIDEHAIDVDLSLGTSDRLFGNDFERLLPEAGRAIIL